MISDCTGSMHLAAVAVCRLPIGGLWDVRAGIVRVEWRLVICDQVQKRLGKHDDRQQPCCLVYRTSCHLPGLLSRGPANSDCRRSPAAGASSASTGLPAPSGGTAAAAAAAAAASRFRFRFSFPCFLLGPSSPLAARSCIVQNICFRCCVPGAYQLSIGAFSFCTAWPCMATGL